MTAATPFLLLILALLLVLVVAMALTSVWGWTVERVAYRPLRGSFRLAPLITAIGMSIILQNFVQLVQGARVKPLPPIITGGYALLESSTASSSSSPTSRSSSSSPPSSLMVGVHRC